MELHFISAETPWLFTRSISKQTKANKLEICHEWNSLTSICFKIYHFISCIVVCLYVSMGSMWAQWPQRPEEGMGTPWTGVGQLWWPCGCGNWIPVLRECCKCRRPPSHLSMCHFRIKRRKSPTMSTPFLLRGTVVTDVNGTFPTPKIKETVLYDSWLKASDVLCSKKG